MNPELYFFPFICSFSIVVVLTAAILFFFKGTGKNTRIEPRHFHSPAICRLGGVAIILSFVATILLDIHLYISQGLWGIIVACSFLLVIGVWDDFWEIDWKIQLFFQIAIVILIFILGVKVEYISNPWGGIIMLNAGKYLLFSLLVMIVWFVLIINSMNWLDGIDGLSSGVTLIGTITIFFLSLRPEVNQPPIGIITMALAGSVIGFLIFNFYPARIIAGTAGATFMGFILASLSIFAGAKIATAFLVMAIPIIDAVWVIWERLKSGESIFKSDRRHLHFKLMEMGWSPRKISLTYYAVTAIVALIALNTRATGKLTAFALIGLVAGAFITFVGRKVKVSPAELKLPHSVNHHS
jgi:UDP-GlcNAc:undecaprenyl-phosphate/decaprenyl-phosphate GlcNAc-1-phosphate transferase